MNNNKVIYLGIGVVIIVGLVVYGFRQNNVKKQTEDITLSVSPTNVEMQQTTKLIGIVKQLNNNSDPAQYSYEITSNFPFFTTIGTGNTQYSKDPMSKIPMLSRNAALQDSMKGFVGKEIIADGLIAWGAAESKYLQVSAITDTSSWRLYTNKTFGYSMKFPTTYQVLPQSSKQISQLGLDNNMVIEKTSEINAGGSNAIIIDVSSNKDNLSLTDYMNSHMKQFNITGPLISFNYNGYDSILNKNQPGTDVFVKNGTNIFHITAHTASSNTEIGNILYTFKFTQ